MSHLIDWENVCLVCLQKGESRFIFGDDNDSNVIADKIMKCSDILIKKDTNQPKNICLQCLNDLNVAYKFRRNCEQSDSIIKSLLNKNHQVFQLNDLWQTTPIIVNPTNDIKIKDEILDNVVVDNTHENTPSFDLKDDPNTETKFDPEVCADTCVHTDAMELKNAKANQRNKPKEEINCAISRPPRRPPKELKEELPAELFQIVDDVVVDGSCENASCHDLADDPHAEDKLVKHIVDDVCDKKGTLSLDLEDDSNTIDKIVIGNRGGAVVFDNAVELNSVEPNQSNKTKQEMDCEISSQTRGSPKASTQKICKICGHSFSGQSALSVHMRRHKKERNFSCDHCDKAFVTSTELRRHVRVHTGQKPYKCQYCGRRFADQSVRKNHESTHTGERPYVCPTCGKTFSLSKGLTVHLRTHTITRKKFVCKECDKEFTRKVLFEIHVADHLIRKESDKSSECKQKKRLEKEIFQIQENANTSEISIKHEIVDDATVDDDECAPCHEFEVDPGSQAEVVKDRGDACTQNNAMELNKAEAIESNKTKQELNSEISKTLTKNSCAKRRRKLVYKTCKICNHSFVGKHALDNHMRRHNNERPFSCEHCDKAFVTATELQRHMRVHTGQKPYKCQYCDRGFAGYSARKTHERKHTGERPYVCPTCGKTFASYTNGLKKHLVIHSRQIVPSKYVSMPW